ncbi:MAG TPA: hypothetical protein VME43_13275 [Bryobacteraceae bacterium]|nr:hypothetical protein [Bryobacteraceae bacterium]
MAALQLNLDALLFDLENPRISKAGSQRDALQKIIEDQDLKLVVLAESIVEDGLNPMDRWLVLKSPTGRTRYTVLEGNRRLAALRLLRNPAAMTDLEVRSAVKKQFEQLAARFDLSAVEPLDCFEVSERTAATTWLNQRHTGENRGSGIVNWGGVATARFRGRDPALQAFDFVLNYGSLTDEEKEKLQDYFPLSTLDRLLSTPDVRAQIGVDVSRGKLTTALPATEVIKPLRKIALELSEQVINVSALKSKEQQVEYVSKLGTDLPDLTKKAAASRAIDEMGEQDFRTTPAAKPVTITRPKAPPVRRTLIPRECYLTVSNPKIAEIVRELRRLLLSDYPHSISVLFRVFLEQSVDHYLDKSGIPLKVATPGGPKDKTLRVKVGEAVKEMAKNGTPAKDLIGVSKGIVDQNSPLHIDTLHAYIHNRFYSPSDRDLKVAWDNAQLFFVNIWK